MSARRQPSTTSLSKFARAHSPEFTNRSLDFCNAFWGLGDGGVDVLFARMRGGIRTMEELRNFWKERAIIEEQYAKRLTTLARYTLGKDEIGDLRHSLDTLRVETEKQASFHMNVAQQVKNDLEGQTNVFLNRQLHHKKNFQAAIEKEFKTKQTQEQYVNKAREKYEGDCVKINAYTAQSTLLQGKDLEKIQLKLERAQQTVQANERDFANFARALQDTVAKWELDWKAFCDSCQDLEEERMEFMKDNMWAYANAVSTVCVSDDESCERMRLALEQLEPEKDMEGFVRDYGTGNAIPDPPAFVNYANPDAVPASSQRPTSRPANFARSTQRVRMTPGPAPYSQEEEPEPTELENTAGIGAGVSRVNSQLMRARSQSRTSIIGQPGRMNGAMPNGIPQQRGMLPDPTADPIDPMTKTMLKVGEHAYDVDLGQNPQARSGSAQNGNGMSPSNVGQDDDPLARQMAQLRQGISSGGSMRRGQPGQNQQPTHQTRESQSNLSPPPGSRGGGPPTKADYRRSAEVVVGAYPGASPSRPASPNPPVANFMRPPSRAEHANGVQQVRDVVADYAQSLPGEHKSVSRPASRAGSYSNTGPSPQPVQQRPDSSMTGVGARGRSPSPQPFVSSSRAPSPSRGISPSSQRGSGPPIQRAPSPGMQPPQQSHMSQNGRRNSVNVHPGAVPLPGMTPQQLSHNARQASISSNQSQPPPRSVSPNPIGISLDPSGRVVTDRLADQYRQSQPQGAPPPQQNFRQPQQPPQRAPSYPAPGQPAYAAPPPGPGPAPAPMYSQAPGYTPSAQPPAVHQQVPPQHQRQPSYGQQQQLQQQHYPPQPYGQPQDYAHVNGQNQTVQRANSVSAPHQQYYGGQAVQPVQQHPQQQVQYGRAPSPMRAPSPQPPQPPQPPVQPPPTGQYTEDGRGVLFYVKALYDYQAVIDEEFDFQTGDIIAVTDTPEDGWWSGELLDEARRQPGRHVFPSNFVCLF